MLEVKTYRADKVQKQGIEASASLQPELNLKLFVIRGWRIFHSGEERAQDEAETERMKLLLYE